MRQKIKFFVAMQYRQISNLPWNQIRHENTKLKAFEFVNLISLC